MQETLVNQIIELIQTIASMHQKIYNIDNKIDSLSSYSKDESEIKKLTKEMDELEVKKEDLELKLLSLIDYDNEKLEMLIEKINDIDLTHSYNRMCEELKAIRKKVITKRISAIDIQLANVNNKIDSLECGSPNKKNLDDLYDLCNELETQKETLMKKLKQDENKPKR